MAGWDRARFYMIDGAEYPSVTTILGIIDKSGPLMNWAVNEERATFKDALLDVLTRDKTPTVDTIWQEVEKATKGVKAHKKASDKAAAIGTAAHAYIEWRTKGLLGIDKGDEPVIPDAARLAVMAWEDWAKAVEFRPVFSERVVYHPRYGYAGTLDMLAYVKDRLTVIDWKTGKAVYPEAYLQNVAYRAALAYQENIPVNADGPYQGLILRLPKTLDDPAFEPVWVPDDTTMVPFLAALDLWRWQRQASGQKVGTLPTSGNL